MTGGLRPFVVVSGLPGSGKSTLAVALAAELDLPLIDKDDILEALFDTYVTVDAALRQRLSRAADRVMAKLAVMSQGAVLVSFWRHEERMNDSGTATDWLRPLAGRLVEVHCSCPARLAEERFLARRRHPGHNDHLRRRDLRGQLEQLCALGPLNIGTLITVSTASTLDLSAIAQCVRSELDGHRG